MPPLTLAERSAPDTPARPARSTRAAAPRGVRGLLAKAAGRGSQGESAPIPTRFAPPSWDEMRFARALSLSLGAGQARAQRVHYRSESRAGLLQGHGVRVELGTGGWAERLRFQTPGGARRFAMLHALLSAGPCLLEVRAEQVALLCAPGLSAGGLLRAQEALWSVLRAPQTSTSTLLLARLGSGTLIAEGAFDRRTQGLLRELLDRSQEEVRTLGAEAGCAPAGAMRLEPGRARAWLEPCPSRREATSALARTLARGASRRARGILGRAEPLQELTLCGKPGGRPLRTLPAASEARQVVDRHGAWLLLATDGGRPLGWTLYEAGRLRFTR